MIPNPPHVEGVVATKGIAVECPYCLGIATHYTRIEVFDQSAAKQSTMHVMIYDNVVITSSNIDANPSVAGVGIRMVFDCDACGPNTFNLTVAQQGKSTYLNLEPN